MLAAIVVKILFRSDWALKQLCLKTEHRLWQRCLIKLYGLYQYENGSSVAWNSSFAGQPCFPHGSKSIFISGEARIGKNCVIFQQVTIGSNYVVDSRGRGAPQLGNNCYIGAGAKIVGNVRIGNNVRVGANAVVYKDVPDNSVVLSGEQRTLSGRENVDNHFYSYRGQWVYFDDGHWVPVQDPTTLAALTQR